MPDFGTIAARLGEISTGYLAGAEKKKSDNQKDFYNAIGLASKLGPATGLDVSTVPGIMDPENPYSGNFGDISGKFADQYKVAQDAAAYSRQLDEAKLGVDLQMKDATLQNSRAIAQMNAQSRLDAAAISAGARNQPSWSDMASYKKQLPDMIMSKAQLPNGFDVTSSSGQEATSKLIGDASRFVDSTLTAEERNDPDKVNKMLDMYFEQYQPTVSTKSGFFGMGGSSDVTYSKPIDWSALRRARLTGDWSVFTKAQEETTNPNVVVTPDGQQIDWNNATSKLKARLSTYDGAMRRVETAKAIESLKAAFPAKSEAEIRAAIGAN